MDTTITDVHMDARHGGASVATVTREERLGEGDTTYGDDNTPQG